MIITKYKHNDSHKTIESLSYSLSLLSVYDAEWQASIERNHLCLYSGLIVVSWSTDFCLIISHEKSLWSSTGLGRKGKSREGESEGTFCLAELPFTYEK